MPPRSWLALLWREYLEHRAAFVYFPVGIVIVLALSAISALSLDKVKVVIGMTTPSTLKLFEFGYLALVALWLAYLAVALFFYFGDAFSADGRNNSMLFWKSMPVSDLGMLTSKFVAGVTLFPAIILLVAAVTGLMYFAAVSVATAMFSGLLVPAPIPMLLSFGQISLLMLAYVGLALVWYAPFLAWLAGLSTIFGRWSLPLAFVIPGLVTVVENVALFGYGPRGGYVWTYLNRRMQFGLSEADYANLVVSPAPFEAAPYLRSLWSSLDWIGISTGVAFACATIWLASQYRRRRLA